MIRDTLENFAKTNAGMLYTDRYSLVVSTGMPGEGKSCFTSQLAEAVSKVTKVPFSYDGNMTYQRKELKQWIDGDKKGKGRMPERSSILADELISMFFKRNWYDSEQIDGIELLNKCRDRHHLIVGNIPNFWDLDSAIYPLVTFWVHVFERGRAWVFQQDRSPFATDKWHRLANEKLFRKKHNPYSCKNFVCEILFDDWSPQDKREYYAVRNIKRLRTEGQRKKDERYTDIKRQRDALLRLAFKLKPKLTNVDVHNIVPSLSAEAVRLIRYNKR